MRKILLFAFIGCFVSSKAQDIDVLNYKFVIFLSDKTDTLNGLAIITFVHQIENPNIALDLTSVNKDGRGMKVYAVGADTQSSRLNFAQSAEKILVKHPSLKKGDTGTLFITYSGIPADGLIISKNKYSDRTFFADNWPNRAHHWIPCIDKPDDKASFEFMVVAPAHYSVVSNGLKMKEEKLGNGMRLTHWKEKIPQPTKVMVIGVAKFATKVYDDSPKDIPVSAWVYPQDSTKGFYDYGLAPGILKFFADYIGPYPYKKLANVQSKTIFGGMENASAIFYAEHSVTGDRSKEDLLAHEIAHQWFGDMASEKSFAHLWLSEGFATYLTNFYFEKKYGKDAAAKRWKESREEVIAFAQQSSKAVVDSTKDLMSLLNANSYQKGSWVLYMLRNEVGDSVFQNIIRTYYNQYKGGNAETRDFEAVAEKVSGKELTWFFDQWLYQPRIPKLKITVKKLNDTSRSITVEQTSEKIFRFPLIAGTIVGDNRRIIKVLNIANKIETFTWETIEKPKKLVFDPYISLLFDGTIIE